MMPTSIFRDNYGLDSAYTPLYPCARLSHKIREASLKASRDNLQTLKVYSLKAFLATDGQHTFERWAIPWTITPDECVRWSFSIK